MRAEILIFDGVDDLDVAGAYEVLTRAVHLGAVLGVRLVVLPGRELRVVTAHGLTQEAHEELSGAADLLIVPRAGWAKRPSAGIRSEIGAGDLPQAVLAAHMAGSVVASVGTGVMALASAGGLSARRAATHHGAFNDLARAGVVVVSEGVVDDGDLVTSGGVTAGLDLGLHLVVRCCGSDLAAQIATDLEYPCPAGLDASAEPTTALRLRLGSIDLGIARLGPAEVIPAWAQSASWASVSRTDSELSIVCPLSESPSTLTTSGPWRALSVAGPLSHDLVGILSELARPLAKASIPIFAISSFDTDHVLVRTADVERAVTALESVGHHVARECDTRDRPRLESGPSL
ncbi:MAG: ACT domain-containing protein [Candidatus Dormibacteria bacterium]